MHSLRQILIALTLTLAFPFGAAHAAEPAGSGVLVPEQAAAIMPLNEIRIGMKGYGLSVFQGTSIEPFPVEVIAIMPNSSPARGTVWISCPSERMQRSGPVQGMSGSPIFLWGEGEAEELGKGGKLIGAFAFGYSLSKGCLVGVQPIEYMREIAPRAKASAEAGAVAAAPGSTVRHAAEDLASLQRIATLEGVPASERVRLDLFAELVKREAGRVPKPKRPAAEAQLPVSTGQVTIDPARVQPLMLPMQVGSPQVARLFSPLLARHGIDLAAAPQALVSGSPPPSIDADSASIRPGSVLSIPLAYGDLDLSAVGTVTDVLPDGTVLGFGHPMFGAGRSSVPMATGYVHFVVPRLTTSFKNSGTLNIVGSLTQDEAPGVAGLGVSVYQSAPLTVRVRGVDTPERTYRYHVVHHPVLTPQLVAMLVMQSATADQQFPPENTVHMQASLTFAGGRKLDFESLMPSANPRGLAFEIMPIVATLMQNPHQNLRLESATVQIETEPRLQVATVTDAVLSKAEVAPGEQVAVRVTLTPYGKQPVTRTLRLRVPSDLPEGDYSLALLDASSYASRYFGMRPHLFATESVDDLYEVVQQVLAIPRTGLYLSMQLPRQGIALGREELPQLPSAVRAMIATPTSTFATAYAETVDSSIETDYVVQGQLDFVLAVRRAQPPAAPAQQ